MEVSATDARTATSGSTDTVSGEPVFEIGMWLSGLESFLEGGSHFFVDEKGFRGSRDWSKEFRLTHNVLQLCSELSLTVGKRFVDSEPGVGGVTRDELSDLEGKIRDAIVLSEAFGRAEPLNFAEWKSWSATLAERLRFSAAFPKLVGESESIGEKYLPAALTELVNSRPLPETERADLLMILPRFARILKWLSVVGRMLANDEPLKPALLIFARVQEQTRELINHIDNRLARFSSDNTSLFAQLDGASYTASMELKKVYNLELAGLTGVRPSPSIYARMETAFALLNDSFEQILAGFARLMDPDVNVAAIFPSFQRKFEQSVVLRDDLWSALQKVKQAEQDPGKKTLDELNKLLADFLAVPARFLFYKDREAVERFVEEISITADKRDLVPILHRFGAFLETLLGQVNMRAVLAGHPFEPK